MTEAPTGVRKRELFAWCMFDFANSSYTTVIGTVVYAVYFVKVVAEGAGLSKESADLAWGLGGFLSQGLVLLTAPIVGAICDFSAAKKKALFVTYLGCVLGTAALGLVGPGALVAGLFFFIVSNVFYSSGENLIAAFLPEIARRESLGRVSGFGWALGYFGGLGSLLACLPFMQGNIDLEHADTVRYAFLVTAGFFFLGALPTFLWLRERAVPRPLPPGVGYLKVGFLRVRETLRHVRHHRQLFRFLCVFFVYASGINIVVAYSGIFAERELGMSSGELIRFFIILQVSASVGAFLFGLLQDRQSARVALCLSLVLWLLVCVGGYYTTDKGWFLVVGNLAGLAMGSSQSGARALVGTFSPPGRSAEFFGFWGLFWKLAGVGPLAFGTLRQWLDTRSSILATGILFLLGLVGVLWIDEEEGRRAALESPVNGQTP